MEKERRVKALSLVALLITIVGLTVAFAAMSRTLTINGTATMDTARWNIHFANITNNKVHAATVNSAQITGETTITYGVTLTKPGDKAEIEFDVVNSGDIDAYIGGLNVFTLNCENETGDRNIVCNNLEWSLKYKETGNTNIVAVNDTLTAGQTRHMIYEIGYKESAETLPEDDVTFNDLQITITYNQDMGVSQDSSGGDISSDTEALTYPIEGTITNANNENEVVSYTLTSDGKIILSGFQTIELTGPEYNYYNGDETLYLGPAMSQDICNKMNLNEDGCDAFSDLLSGDSTYSELMSEDRTSGFTPEEKSEYLANITRLSNIVPATTLEFASEVTTITDSNLKVGRFGNISTIIVSSSVSNLPDWASIGINVTYK